MSGPAWSTRVASRSEPGQSHTVTVSPQGEARCTCWKFKTQRACHHQVAGLERWLRERGGYPFDTVRPARFSAASAATTTGAAREFEGMIMGRDDQLAWEASRRRPLS